MIDGIIALSLFFEQSQDGIILHSTVQESCAKTATRFFVFVGSCQRDNVITAGMTSFISLDIIVVLVLFNFNKVL